MLKDPLIFFPLHAVRRLDLRLLLPDLCPVGAEHSASTLLETLVHRPLGVITGVPVDLLKHLVEGGLPFLLLFGLRGESLLYRRSVSPAGVRVLDRSGSSRGCSVRSSGKRSASVTLQRGPSDPLGLLELDLYLCAHHLVSTLLRGDGMRQVQLQAVIQSQISIQVT